ncbi:hypothetical protein [Paracraurococcus lichenis]|uniref:Uncharacterized protein n=1 Tax=Paracraurococcus lichenis TaxID=3064888 RepID=A0ABT9EDD7_9PROT|nr:hypothetical protein [Paracraurococcus sp. LOR1-02]MDO9714242.1 hypothetical protein [Paracraurococcus sp. LOR1-02]
MRDLEPEALFCIAVLRTWVAAHRPDGAATPDWHAVCAEGELTDDAVQAFGAFLDALRRGMRRPLDIRCRLCPLVGRDEEFLLALLGALQRGDVLSGLDVLADWLEQPAVMPALPLAMRLAAAARDCEICIHAPAPAPPRSGSCNGSAWAARLH